jgi:hypothetical protein
LPEQLVHHLDGGERVVLKGGDKIGGRLASGAALGLAFGLEVGVPQDGFAIPRGEIERRPGSNFLAVDDIA